MMDAEALDDLYREIILSHARHPHTMGTLPNADVTSEGNNPIRGDEVTLQLAFDRERVSGVRFRGRGCSISQASASLLTDAVTGQEAGDLPALIEEVEAFLKGQARAGPDLGDLEALQGVARFPARVKCALLAWKVLQRALAERGGAPLPEALEPPGPAPHARPPLSKPLAPAAAIRPRPLKTPPNRGCPLEVLSVAVRNKHWSLRRRSFTGQTSRRGAMNSSVRSALVRRSALRRRGVRLLGQLPLTNALDATSWCRLSAGGSRPRCHQCHRCQRIASLAGQPSIRCSGDWRESKSAG